MYPNEVTALTAAEKEELAKHYSGEANFVRIGPKKYFLSDKFGDHAEQFYNMEVRNDDVWIVTYPRSGTTWSQELVWLLLNDLDVEKARQVHHANKVLFLEMSTLAGKKHEERMRKELDQNDEKTQKFLQKFGQLGYEAAKTMESPRCIKSHLALSLLPPKLLDTAKVIYVARNPKDCAVSNYYHQLGGPNGLDCDFDQYWPLFEKGNSMFGPHIEHVKEAWDLRSHPNLMFYFYEDLKKDLSGMIKKVATFLGKEVSDDDVGKIEKHLSFENMKELDQQVAPPFPRKPNEKRKFVHFRQGKTGYQDEFKNLGSRPDEWIAAEGQRTGIEFPKV